MPLGGFTSLAMAQVCHKVMVRGPSEKIQI
jgi:hypothetical protein